MADVPVGAFLSGGPRQLGDRRAHGDAVDAARCRRSRSAFLDASDSELPWARRVAERYGTVHHEAVVTPAMTDVVAESVRHHGEPFADSSAVATYCLAEDDPSARHRGALGRRKRRDVRRLHALRDRAAGARARRPARTAARRAYRSGVRAVMRAAAPHVHGLRRTTSRTARRSATRTSCASSRPRRRTPSTRPPCAPSRTAPSPSASRVCCPRVARASRLGRLIDLDWHTYLTDDINAKVDIASMAHALEVRCPFLDTDVVEFAARLPRKHADARPGQALAEAGGARSGARGDHAKAQARLRVASPALDEAGPRRAWSGTYSSIAPRGERGLFEPREVNRLVLAMDRDRDAPDRVWTLLVLELWFREFIDGASGAAPGYSWIGSSETTTPSPSA